MQWNEILSFIDGSNEINKNLRHYKFRIYTFSNSVVTNNGIIITNKNYPGIISQVAETLANEKINILEFVNKSRGEYACNIIDSDEKFDVETISKLHNINGVTNARLCY